MMKPYYYILLSILFFTFTFSAAAGAYEYSLSVKTTFMQGCLLDDPPDFNNNSAVFIKMKRCLCMMDKFEKRYSEEQFMDLFAHAEKNYSCRKENLMILLKIQCPVVYNLISFPNSFTF